MLFLKGPKYPRPFTPMKMYIFVWLRKKKGQGENQSKSGTDKININRLLKDLKVWQIQKKIKKKYLYKKFSKICR